MISAGLNVSVLRIARGTHFGSFRIIRIFGGEIVIFEKNFNIFELFVVNIKCSSTSENDVSS